MNGTQATSGYIPTYADEIAISRYFIQVLERRLAGRDKPRAVDTLPVDWCHIGVLGPWKSDVVELESDELVPAEGESSQDETSQTGLQNVTRGLPRSTAANISTKTYHGNAEALDRGENREGSRRPPSAIGLEIVVEPDSEGIVEIKVKGSFAIYTKHLPSFDEQKTLAENSPLAEVAQRWNVEIPPVTFTVRVEAGGRVTLNDEGLLRAQIDAVLLTAGALPNIAKQWPTNHPRPKVDGPTLRDEETFNSWLRQTIAGLPNDLSSLAGRIELRARTLPDGKARIGCYLRNDTPSRGKAFQDAFLIFGDAKIVAEIQRGELYPIEILPVPRDYQYDRRVWAVGHNTSVRVDAKHEELTTETLARYEQTRIVTRDDPPAKFEELASDPIPTLENIRLAMEAYANDWESRVVGRNELGMSDNELAECKTDLVSYRDELGRFCSGIAAINSDPRLFDSFCAMNRVFARLATGYNTWRLFQIVFIVTQIPALAMCEGKAKGEWPKGVTRDWTDILEWGDVLWFRTGGGKTEAYLGLTCCAMLYDRLRGKGFGVTAWLRFPLRMLSIQQLQRAMRMVWEAEKERKTLLGAQAAGSDSFRLGYFVGSTTTPNGLNAELMEDYKKPERAEKLRVVPDCPECGGVGTVFVNPDIQAMCFRHVCNTCKTELPLDVSDDEVYRKLPSLIIGTVDKMATVGQQVKFGMLWGAARWCCPAHGYGFGDYCFSFDCRVPKKSRTRVVPYDPAPTLHIQDELHLLQEELGAFSGHYETLIRYCEETANGRPAKVVAATATIEGFEHQVRDLYGVKKARRFPGRGYDKLRSFYAKPDKLDEQNSKTARIFVAFRSASMHAADASAFCTEILQTEVNHLMLEPSAALAILNDAQTEADVRTLLRYYTTTLNYVGSLARGSRVSQVLEESAGRTRTESGREMSVEYHNSRSTGAEVADLVHRIENPNAWEESSFLDALVATSMISHGVDLERINLMTMDGMPEETAEYIQASSRSGRKHVGLVVVVLPSYSIRATSIYHRFLEYHDHLDRMVSPVPVNRFAKFAAKRTLPGVFVGLIYGRHVVTTGNEKLKKRANASAMIQGLTGGGLATDIHRAYALRMGIYDEGLERGLEELLNQELPSVELSVRNSPESNLKDAVKPAPMTSLRDVEVGVPFNPDVDYSVLAWLRATKE